MDKEEAMKILKDFHDKSAIFSVRTALETLHSELKESEDEKIVNAIRKALESKIEDLGNGVTRTACLAWLEKQGELVNSLSKGLDNAHERIDELIQKNNKLCIKLEQKPAWSEEDEKMIGRIRGIVEAYAFSQSAVDVNGDLCEKKFIDVDIWLKSLKQRIGGKL